MSHRREAMKRLLTEGEREGRLTCRSDGRKGIFHLRKREGRGTSDVEADMRTCDLREGDV